MYGHLSDIYKHYLIIIGGYKEKKYQNFNNDILIFNLNNNTIIKIKDSLPINTSMQLNSMNIIHNEIFILCHDFCQNFIYKTKIENVITKQKIKWEKYITLQTTFLFYSMFYYSSKLSTCIL